MLLISYILLEKTTLFIYRSLLCGLAIIMIILFLSYRYILYIGGIHAKIVSVGTNSHIYVDSKETHMWAIVVFNNECLLFAAWKSEKSKDGMQNGSLDPHWSLSGRQFIEVLSKIAPVFWLAFDVSLIINGLC